MQSSIRAWATELVSKVMVLWEWLCLPRNNSASPSHYNCQRDWGCWKQSGFLPSHKTPRKWTRFCFLLYYDKVLKLWASHVSPPNSYHGSLLYLNTGVSYISVPYPINPSTFWASCSATSKTSQSSIFFDILIISPCWVETSNFGLFPTLETSQPILTSCPLMSCSLLGVCCGSGCCFLIILSFAMATKQKQQTILITPLPATASNAPIRPCPSPLNYSVPL